MEYERIHRVQTGIISPSKLRMKLIGQHQWKKEGSNSNSSRTSPSKLEDAEFVKNSLLATNSGDSDEGVSGFEVPSVKSSGNSLSGAGRGDQNSCHTRDLMERENGNAGRIKMQQIPKGDGSNMSSLYPVRTLEDENLDYDSTSSFEFQGERSLHNPMARSLSRPMSSKWNDAEKWIMNRHNVQGNYSKKNYMQNQASRGCVMNMVRVAPESASYDNKLAVKRVDFCQSTLQIGLEKFSFAPSEAHPVTGQVNELIDLCPQSRDLKEVDYRDFSCTKSSTDDTTGLPAIRSVSMRDMGTEMTPIPSQGPSTSATPVEATTPRRSPTSSMPSSPRRGEPAPTPTECTTYDARKHSTENGKKELSEQELKLKTRKEIVALGVQLGKMNIATWASKDDKEKNSSAAERIYADKLEQIEFGKCAAEWEEAEKSKHAARYKREEIKIQAWESQQKAKLEGEMKRVEAKVEQMRAQAQAKVVKKIAMARQRSEEKRAAAEARKNSQAEKTAAQAEYIHQTGRIPSSPFLCCGWS